MSYARSLHIPRTVRPWGFSISQSQSEVVTCLLVLLPVRTGGSFLRCWRDCATLHQKEVSQLTGMLSWNPKFRNQDWYIRGLCFTGKFNRKGLTTISLTLGYTVSSLWETTNNIWLAGKQSYDSATFRERRNSLKKLRGFQARSNLTFNTTAWFKHENEMQYLFSIASIFSHHFPEGL